MFQRTNGIWYADFVYRGQRYRESLETTDRNEAQEQETKLKAKVHKREKLGECVWTWEEAAASYFAERRHHKALVNTHTQVKWLNKFLAGKTLDEIDARLIGEIVKVSNNTIGNSNRNCTDYRSPETTNHHLRTIRKILNHAVAKGELDASPNIKLLHVPKRSRRFLSVAEADQLLEVIAKGPRSRHLFDGVRFALATGLRHSNIVGLEWRNVHLDVAQPYLFVEAQSSKSGKPIRIPLSTIPGRDEALQILRAWQGGHPTHVFHFRGGPLLSINGSGFQAARKAAGLPWLRFHDLRHAWASWHAMGGTPLSVLQQLGGWASLDMVMRYAHLTPSHVDQFAGNATRHPTVTPPVAEPVKVRRPKLFMVG